MVFFLLVWLVIGGLLSLLPERRTLWFGALVFGWLSVFYGVVILALYYATGLTEFTIAQMIVLGLIGVPALALLSLPVWFVFVLIYNGVVLIRREGFSLRNCLALGFGIGSILFTVFHPKLEWLTSIPGLDLLDGLIIIGLNLLAIELIMYVLTTAANSVHISQHQFRAIIVLGAGLMGEEVTPLLARRIDRGIQLWKRQKQECYLVMSGGQGADEVISEAEAMKRYAVKQGIDEKWIILEDQSTNTEENLRNSYQLLSQMEGNLLEKPVAIVTNYFHIFRAMILARELGYPCIGYGARTKFYYSINAVLRDFVGYLSLTWRKQLTIFAFFAIIHTFFWIVQLMNH